MKLLIVESPNKVRKLKELVGDGFRVAASFGHVRDLPPSGGLAVAFRDGRVEPTYQMIERSAKAVGELRTLAERADEVWLASDPDREGEAIAWHLTHLLGPRTYRRVVFHAITRAAVQKAMAGPRDLDRHLVDAQQARRVLDRVVGWVVSPTLRRVGKEAKSAGRVQSVALRLVAEREREIQKFGAVDYFVLAAKLERPGRPPAFTARLWQWKGAPLAQRLTDAAVAERSVDWCRKQRWQVHACERREQSRQPPPPFTTATVQQAASVQLKLVPQDTMKQLQSLFEDGHITYHRTDSTALAPEAAAAARAIIAERFGDAYLPAQPVVHATRAANAQEAHEAIRPTHPEGGPEALSAHPASALYRLVWERFVACQMAPARDQLTTIDVACAPDGWQGGPVGIFRAKGRVVLFDGWRRLGQDATEERKGRGKGREAGEEDEESDAELPMLDVGDPVDLLGLEAQKRTTKPPPRYTQASLIKRLERDGIGRPSTYAAIMTTIMQRGYVLEKVRKLHATELGMQVTDFLVARFAGDFIELDYTARMEDALDRVARGEAEWQKLVTAAAFRTRDLARQAGLWYDPLAEAAPAP